MINRLQIVAKNLPLTHSPRHLTQKNTRLEKDSLQCRKRLHFCR